MHLLRAVKVFPITLGSMCQATGIFQNLHNLHDTGNEKPEEVDVYCREPTLHGHMVLFTVSRAPRIKSFDSRSFYPAALKVYCVCDSLMQGATGERLCW